jgi:tripartite-type tricarboxylate transporter receptor subunit TctC
LPNVPTIAEQGLPNYSFDAWIALIGPAGLPKPIVAEYYKQTKAALSAPEVQNALAAQGITVIGSTPEHAEKFFQSELVKHTKLVKQAGAKLE